VQHSISKTADKGLRIPGATWASTASATLADQLRTQMAPVAMTVYPNSMATCRVGTREIDGRLVCVAYSHRLAALGSATRRQIKIHKAHRTKGHPWPIGSPSL
jgi:hypothetical protein